MVNIVADMDLPFSRKLIIFVMLMIILPNSAAANNNNVSSGSGSGSGSAVLVAEGPNSSWSSPSGDFAFGFRQVSVGGYLLAVVFGKLRQRTIVWSANGNNVAGIGWTLCLSTDGLVLSDPNKKQIWAVKLPGSSVAYGAMLDNGNFVLARNDSTVLWQSFDHPTDTLLPGQVLNRGGSLFSSISDTNHSRGMFEFIMQKDGNLVLHSLKPSMPRNWTSNTPNSEAFRAVFTKLGQFYLATENGTIIKNIFSKPNIRATHFYQRLTFDIDGVLRHYTFNKSAKDAWFVHKNDTLG